MFEVLLFLLYLPLHKLFLVCWFEGNRVAVSLLFLAERLVGLMKAVLIGSLISDQLRKTVVFVAQFSLAERHIATADFAVHELFHQKVEQLVERNVVFLTPLIEVHLLSHLLKDYLQRLWTALRTEQPFTVKDLQKRTHVVLDDVFLMRVRPHLVPQKTLVWLIAMAPFQDFVVGELFEESPEYEKVEEGVYGVALGDEVIEHLDPLVSILVVMQTVDEADQPLFDLQLVLLTADHLLVDPLRQVERSDVTVLTLMLLPKLLVHHLNRFQQLPHWHALGVNVNLGKRVQLFQLSQLPDLHHLPQSFFICNIHAFGTLGIGLCFGSVARVRSQHRRLWRQTDWHLG